MSYFDDASLVMIPSGYKTSKVYSVKPTDGSGDLTFSRSNDTATRVNSAGLIEKVRTNLALQSQTLSVTPTWTAYSGTTVTADAIAAPDGTLTADRIAGTSAAFRGIRQTISSSAIPHTFSVYLKSATGSATTARIWVDSGVSVVNVTTNWQRFSVTATTASSFDIQISTAVSSAIDVYAWGAQLETGDIATDYIATTSAAVSVGPVANVPRLDYLNSSCPRLLLEPQRTNLYLNSEKFNNASWIKSNTTVTANTAISPDGYTNADTLSDIVGTNLEYVLLVTSPISYTSGTTYTVSFYAKNVDRRYMYLRFVTNAFGSNKYAYFDLQNGVISKLDAGATATITSVGNGWYRCTATATATTTVDTIFGIYIGLSADGQNNSYTNAAAKSVYIYGAQLEAGAYATSYIPTLGAAVTRGADAASKTSASALIGQTEGTLFVDFTLNGLADYGTPISVNNGTTSNYIWLTIFANGNLRAELYNGSAQASITYSGAVVGGRYKMAFGYKTNDFAFYVNGALVGTDLVGTTFSGTTLSRVDTDLTNAAVYSAASESINQALLFKTRLTNAQLAELTTL